jgi:hypothetical protein
MWNFTSSDLKQVDIDGGIEGLVRGLEGVHLADRIILTKLE